MTSAFRLGGDGVFRCPELLEFAFADHGFGSRAGNPEANVTLRQVHSDIIWLADGLRDREQEGDALVSASIGCRVGVRTADCVPLLLLDPSTHAVAAIHAGWRGTAAGIGTKAMERLPQRTDSSAAEFRIAIGPCIRSCCYEVGPEVAAQFLALFPEWQGEVRRRPLDLAEANRRQLVAAGMKDEHIFDSGLCTSCLLDRFFSYRREPDNPGRMISAISRVS